MNVKIGSQVGNWKVISEKFKKNKIYWNTCECICGKIVPVRNWWLNHTKSKSCGCSNTKGRFKAKCVGDLSASYYSSFKYNRTSKNIYFSVDITMDYLWELFLLQDNRCAISGITITLNPRWSEQNKGRVTKIIQSASIDRIDNIKGYEIGNVQWVHKDINMMKGSMKESDFIMFCKEVSNNNISNSIIDTNCKLKWYGSSGN